MPEQTPNGRVVETAKEARAGERGPSMVVVLAASTLTVAILFAMIWYWFLQA